MVHTAHQLNPARPPHSERPGLDVAPGTQRATAQHVEEFRDARIVYVFRDALSRRGAERLTVFRVEYPLPLTCWPCFAEAVRSLGGDITRHAAEPGEEGAFERYEDLSFYFERVETRNGPLDDYEDGELPPAEGHDARFFATRAFGLVQITFPESTLWVWSYSLSSEGGEACVAARSRADLRPLLRTVKRLHTAHRRNDSRVTLIGGKRKLPGSLTPLAWEDVVLPEQLRDDLRQTVDEFFGARELYRKHRVPHRRGILLAGPPGNGKTSILRAIGASAGVPIVLTVVDEGGSDLAKAFQSAANLAPSILCLEDLDSLVGEGPGRTQFLNLLDGLQPLDGVLVIATTNHPELIDPAIAKRPSRFDRVFVIPKPALEQREAYLTRELGADAPPGSALQYAEQTAGYSVAFLKELVLQARLAAVRRGDETLTHDDLDSALEHTRKHLNLSGLANRGELGFAPSAPSP